MVIEYWYWHFNRPFCIPIEYTYFYSILFEYWYPVSREVEFSSQISSKSTHSVSFKHPETTRVVAVIFPEFMSRLLTWLLSSTSLDLVCPPSPTPPTHNFSNPDPHP